MAIYLADTNLLLRLRDDLSSQHPIALEAVSVLLAQNAELVITTQNLIEFWAVATRPIQNNGLGRSPSETAEEIGLLRELLRHIADPPEVFELWWNLVQQHEVCGKRAHDARLVAVMKANRINHLLTFNIDDFRCFDGIAVVDPRTII